MPWFNLRKPANTPNEDTAQKPDPEQKPAPQQGARTLPLHMQRIVEDRSRPQRDVSVEARRAAFERKRLAIEFDIAQGELASEEENPWTHRIELLTEALETVKEDQQALKHMTPEPSAPVPLVPITDITIEKGEGINVGFSIDGHRFRYEEVLDWSERGHTVAAPELRVVECPVGEIIPDAIPDDLREPLTRHLTDSLAVFATDLRDRALDDAPIPESPTLADLARECPICGGWADWNGRCDACTRRKGQEQALRMEQNRLLQERANEAEERHRLAERLPLARRRLRDLEDDIAACERQQGG